MQSYRLSETSAMPIAFMLSAVVGELVVEIVIQHRSQHCEIERFVRRQRRVSDPEFRFESCHHIPMVVFRTYRRFLQLELAVPPVESLAKSDA